MYLKEIQVPIPFDRGEDRHPEGKDGGNGTEPDLPAGDEGLPGGPRTIRQMVPLYEDQMYPNENYFVLVPNDVPEHIRDAILIRCARKKEQARLRKDPAAMARRVSERIAMLKEKGEKSAMAQEKKKGRWYITSRNDLDYLMKVFSSLYLQTESYCSRHPDNVMSLFKVRMFNRILEELKVGLPDHQILQDLKLIEEPKTEKDAEGNATCSGRTNSDVLMLLTWYKDALGGL